MGARRSVLGKPARSNAGDLALNWKLTINTDNENYVIDPNTNAYNGLSKALKVGIVPGGITAQERAEVVASVDRADWIALSSFSANGQLLPEGEGTYEETFGIVIWWEPGDNDNLWNLNNGKQLSSGDVLSIDLGVHLVASQQTFENDSFGADYDAEASYSFSGSYSHSAAVAADADGKVAADVTVGNTEDAVSAQVAAGTKLEAGVTDMTLTVTTMETSANITVGEDETANSVDVHVSGLAEDNDVPVLVTVKHLLPKYMNEGNYTLYHVENGTPVRMTPVAEPAAHNEYSYDPLTGDVTMALASFSEISVVTAADRTWKGVTAQAFSGGNGTAENPYLIASADQLALMSKLISRNNEAYSNYKYVGTKPEIESFASACYKLAAEIKFPGEAATSVLENDSLTYYPAGYWFTEKNDDANEPIYKYGAAFSGTFDGAGHSISGIYQNTWQMNGEYNDGYSGKPNYWNAAMGLFGEVENATIKNLTLVDFTSDGEFTPTGCIAAFAGGTSTFENISLEHCNPRVYNTGNGGIVGLNSNIGVDQLTFKNITVDQTNTISALWGSYDVSCGGILGRLRDNDANEVYNTAEFVNCHVAAVMDVYNDVCANYQYYQYRYSGMFIGTVDYVDTIHLDGIKTKNIVTATDCTVHIGDWNQYWYCELVENSLASYTHDHQFSRLENISSVRDISNAESEENISESTVWNKTGDFVIPADSENDAKCFHIRQKADGTFYQHTHESAGEETINGEVILKEDRQHYHLPFNQLFTGYGWGSTPVFPREFGGIELEDHKDSVEKFEQNKNPENGIVIQSNTVLLKQNTTYKVSDLFQAIENYDIQDESVQVLLSTQNNALKMKYDPNTEDWTQGTVTFTTTGEGILTINDYSYCKPTSIQIAVDAEKSAHAAHCTCGNTGVSDGCNSENLYGWVAWDGKSDLPSGGNYYLTGNITGGTQRWIGQRFDETGNNANTVINLCLNGHSITSTNRIFGFGQGVTVNLMNCQKTNSVLVGSGTLSDGATKNMAQAGLFLVQGSVTLNIYDGIGMQFKERNHGSQNDSNIPTNGGIMEITSGAVVNMYGGTMEDGQAQAGGSVYVTGEGSAFNLYSGTISNGQTVLVSQTNPWGGNIYVGSDASFTMYGGTIENGTATLGGNIYQAARAVVTLKAGTVTDGEATNAEGGNIYVGESSKLILNDAEIRNGTATGGGNVFVNTKASFTMEGGTIQGASANQGGAVYTKGTFNMYGGEIVGGYVGSDTVQGKGAAVYMDTGATWNLYGGTVRGGSGKLDGETNIRSLGGVAYLTGEAQFNMSGGTVYGGKVGDGGVFWAGSNSTINITGGTIYAGYANFGGGAAKLMNTSNFIMSGGEIIGTADESYPTTLDYNHNAGGAGGGALFVENSSKVTITGNAKITGCTTTNLGGAIKVYNPDATITVGGNAKITDNYKYVGNELVRNNINLSGINSNGEYIYAKALNLENLSGDAKIGISMDDERQNKTTVFTNAATQEMAEAFQSDNAEYEVVFEEDKGCLVLQKTAVEDTTNP